jgi:hypothetical protein
MRALRTVRVLPILAIVLGAPAAAQAGGEEPEIEVSGLLVEEAYNQEAGQLQQIVRAVAPRGGGWSAEYTQEWPVFSERHQLDLELGLDGDEGITSLGAGWRFLVTGGEDAPFTLSPGVEAEWSREEDEWEGGIEIPASLKLGEALTSNTSLGVSFGLSDGISKPAWTVGEGVFWRATPRLNALVEAQWARGGEPILPGDGETSLLVSPGLQYAVVLSENVQVVPGIAVPIGVGPSGGERALLIYFSVEHPFKR